MLAERYVNDRLSEIVQAQADYHTYPIGAERAIWDALPEPARTGRIAAGNKYLDFDWPALPATLFMEFSRDGNRNRYEKAHFQRRRALSSLVLAECFEWNGRFLDQIVNGIWLLCEESFWGVPATTRPIGVPLPDTGAPVVDLFSSETAGLLAWTWYLIGDKLDSVSPVIGERIRREIQVRIFDPYLSEYFWWMGLGPEYGERAVNNWNPWCNSNCLSAVLLLETDPKRRIDLISKILRSLDRFLASYHADGGCDEGTSYWNRAGGSLLDCLELLKGASGGKIDVYNEPLVQNIGRYLYRAYIDRNFFVNFADGAAKVQIWPDVVYRYGKRIGDPRLMGLGADAFQRYRTEARTGDVPEPLLRALPALFEYQELDAAAAEPPYVRDVWLSGIEVMTAREQEGSAAGLYVAAKGGNNAESHNHNDVGQFLVYSNGSPVLIDVGVETYTAKTFNADRYDIWTMQSAYHNLPTIGGFQQSVGGEFAARDVVYEADDAHAQLTLDIALAYPVEAGIRSWIRTVRLDRGDEAEVMISDRFQFDRTSEVKMSLMTPLAPDISRSGIITLTGQQTASIQYPVETYAAVSERIPIDDAKLLAVWGDHLYRITLTARERLVQGDMTLRVRPGLY